MADTREHHNRHKDLPEQKDEDKRTTAPLNEAPHYNRLATAGVDNPADKREVKED